jgi:hypothetical protein
MQEGICEYRMLADAVGDAFNPRDDDVAEVSLLIATVEHIRDVLTAMPCTCPDVEFFEEDPCGRCSALGQWRGKAVQR